MIIINWDVLNEEQQSFVEEIVGDSVCDICHAEEVDPMIEKLIMQ